VASERYDIGVDAMGHLVGSVSNSHVAVQSIDPLRCAFCEGTLPIAGVGTAGSTPFGCGTIAGGGPPDEALVAGSDVNGVFAQLFRAVDGDVTALGGGCGLGGSAVATCPRSANQSFAHRLRNSAPGAPTIFVISGLPSQFTCGTCTLIPDLATAIFLITNTTAAGAAEIPFVIPVNSSLRGIPLFEQWATFHFAQPVCGQFFLDFSNALRVVIE
jgi:hypothetical protein